jgi:5-methylcytosine-specific restriction protein A
VRREFPARVKAAALKRCMDEKGVPYCEGVVDWLALDATMRVRCNVELRAGNIFYDHHKADGLGGEPTLENARVLCKNCHDAKTFGEDNPRMAKADNQRKRNFGIKARKGRPLPGTKASGLKKKMNGTVERRT